MKYLVLILFLTINCASVDTKINYEPSIESGCASIQETKARLSCISKMLKTLEGIRNAKISVSEKEGDRVDSEFVSIVETYCFTNKEETESFLCFESRGKLKYKPTFIGQLQSFGWKFLSGLAAGVALIWL